MSESLREPSPSRAVRGTAGTRVRRQIVAARKLRANQTEMERKLWRRIREKQIEGFRFRRQRPIGKYIVDFVCMEARLIVELDGGQHADTLVADAIRTQFLKSLGYEVVRFWNNEVVGCMDSVLERIREALFESAQSNPTPTLPLPGEGAERAGVGVHTKTPSPAARGKAGMGVRVCAAAAKREAKAPIS